MMNTRFRYLLFLTMVVISFTNCSQKTYVVKDQNVQYYKFQKNKNESSDVTVESTIKPYRLELKKEMDEILIWSETELTRKKPNSTLGNWITDVILDEIQTHTKVNVDCAFQNYGGIRINSMPMGGITKGKIYEVMPFENMTVILHINGEILQKLCNRIAEYGGWPISKGIKFTIAKNKKATNIMIHEEPLHLEQMYHIAIADYVANGGDNCDFLKDVDRTETGILIRNLIIDHLRNKHTKGEKINIKLEERIKLAD